MKLTLTLIAVAYLLVSALLFYLQRSLLYFPSPTYKHDFKTLTVENDGERINVVVLNPGKRAAILYFGGNAEPVVFNAEPFTGHFTEHTVYLVEYRGYGESTGSPSEAGLFSDSIKVFDAVKDRHQSIAVIGRSLGSGVASYLATQREVRKLALVTPFDSISNVAKKKMPLFPVSLLLKDKYDSASRASQIESDVFIVAAELDNVVPMQHAQQLAKAFKTSQVQTPFLKGMDHNNISLHPEYYPTLAKFLE